MLNRELYEDATGAFLCALEQEPDYFDAWCGLGRSYEGQHKYADAANAYEHVVVLMPGEWLGWSRLGLCYSYLDRYPESIAAHERSVKLIAPSQPDRDRVLALSFLGMAYIKIRDFTKAEQIVVKLNKIAPKVGEEVAQAMADAQRGSMS